ncbi:MAG: thioredoxin domain-containing protein [Desulfobulbaceae bacterium]|nr:thioredoxin domain-containing protein [Desulfobulbaceae bacterium]
MLGAYPNEVKLVFKNFPLTRIHKFAMGAAVAALAANEQGKFWEYHDKLFENYKSLSHKKFQEIAQELGLDMKRFNTDLSNPKLRQAVSKDMDDAVKNGIRSTPTILVNNRSLRNNYRNFSGMKKVIEKELKRLK